MPKIITKILHTRFVTLLLEGLIKFPVAKNIFKVSSDFLHVDLKL